MTTAQKRKAVMARLARLAKKQEARGDLALAEQAAKNWADYATRAEIRRAPRYIRRWLAH